MTNFLSARGKKDEKEVDLPENQKIEVIGTIDWYGSAPFVILGFKTLDGKTYAIKLAESANFTKEEIGLYKGKRLSLRGRVKKQGLGFEYLDDGVFIVEEFNEISRE